MTPASSAASQPAGRDTDRWRAAVTDLALPELSPAADIAERLLLLVHYSIDWQDGWVSGHRHRYWDEVLPDRIQRATNRSDTLYTWWTLVAASLECSPRDRTKRAEVVELLGHRADEVLAVLRSDLIALLLRVRIIAESVAESRKGASE